MKSEAYWSKRMEQLNESLLNKGVPFTKAMNKEYRKAQISVQTDVNNFYQRFADNNGIVSLSAAKQVLKAGELKEFKWTVEDYIARGKENAIDQRWMEELENASIRVRVTRLESIQLQMKQHVEELSAKRLTGTTELLGNVYKDGYYRSIFELEKGIGIGASFSKLDKRQLEAILSAPWAPDGSNFSSRIWTDRVRLNGELRNIFTQGLIRGDTSKQMIQQLQDRMGVSEKAATRLILTESAYFAGQSRLAGYKELGVEEYRFTATLDNRTSAKCQDMDGKVFAISDAVVNVNYPPLHAHCRSTTIPHYDDNIKARVARDEDGKTETIPEDINYKEWAEKYAPEATETVSVETPSKQAPETLLPTIEIPGGPRKDIPIPEKSIYTLEPEKWYDETGKTAPPLINLSKMDLPKLQPDIPRKLGNIDLSKPDIVRNYVKDAEQAIRNAPEEHAIALTKEGEVIHVKGDKASVDITKIKPPDVLKKSIVTHNHPTVDGEPGGSFSRDDVLAFIKNGIKELRAVDSSSTYILKKSAPINLSTDEINRLLDKAEDSYLALLTIEQALTGYDEKHLTMEQLVMLLESLQYTKE
ncbi:SPP1 gp7 family putative phage head morphogenesis protein [Paenibacillus sp. PastF-3]|uniref:minor capsid protein n=1 Tax=Paenibacillus sp. PastF-3 TaxID=2940626 RepID=UPI002476F8AB|nr:minor capsid protein [Paenibacillus sp. PastF-3]MDH6371772.1 SPP1 gp7 family putative phage head morphogenesis protein [Paenibacillus sp. PastF-3]